MGNKDSQIAKCPICGQGYIKEYGPWCDCLNQPWYKTAPKNKYALRQPSNGSVDIPQGNIKTYLYWRDILTKINAMPYIEQDYNTPLSKLREIQKEYNLDQVWLWATYTPITRELNKRDGLLDPFREVKRLMVYGQVYRRVLYSELYPNSSSTSKGYFNQRDYRKKREGKGGTINWAFNLLLAAIVEDCHWYGNGKKFVETEHILSDLDVAEAQDLDYNALRVHYKGIDITDLQTIIEALYEACSKTRTPFIPKGVAISEWPPDFLARIANLVGYKKNPYLSGEKHMTDAIRKKLPPHLKKLLASRR